VRAGAEAVIFRAGKYGDSINARFLRLIIK